MTLKVGLIGLGMMGRHHARVLREMDGLTLVALADPGGDPHGVAADLPLYRSTHDLLTHGVDAAVVAVPTRYHQAVGLEVAEAGVHALIEKPIAHSIEAGLSLVKAFESRGLVGVVGHIERFNPALMDLRKRLESGDLGDVYQVHTRRQGPYPSRVSDVGVVKDLASHDIDLTRWLSNSVYAQVSAQTAFRSGRAHEDMVNISAKLQSGLITSHLVNWLTPYKERITVVTGERGAYVADTLTADLTYYENGSKASKWDAVTAFRGVTEGTITRFALAKKEPLLAELEAFRDMIRGERSDAVTLREGLSVLRVCEAALHSAQTGELVYVNESLS